MVPHCQALCDYDKLLLFSCKCALCNVSENYCHSDLQVYFGTAQARIYLVADFLRVNCHTGMSALMRKALIDEVGGIEAFSCYLAEDFFLAKSLKERGWRMCISSQPAWQNSGVCEINSFQARLTR
jgi:ceramide glucosyltransferase